MAKADVETGPRRDFIQMQDLVPISSILKHPQFSNYVNESCSLKKGIGRDLAKYNNSFHLALEHEKRSVGTKEAVDCK